MKYIWTVSYSSTNGATKQQQPESKLYRYFSDWRHLWTRQGKNKWQFSLFSLKNIESSMTNCSKVFCLFNFHWIQIVLLALVWDLDHGNHDCGSTKQSMEIEIVEWLDYVAQQLTGHFWDLKHVWNSRKWF